MSRALTTPIPAADQTWLHMDRPNNLMYVHSVMWFARAPEWDAFTAVLQERLVDRFPVFSCRAVEVSGQWCWEPDPDFDLAQHARPITVSGDEADLKTYISRRFSEPFDKQRPLWEVELITGIDGLPAVMLARFHHALADGIRLTQLLLSLCDLETDALPPRVGRPGTGLSGLAGSRLLAATTALVRQSVADGVDAARGVAALPARMLGSGLGAGWELVTRPRTAIDVLARIGSQDNSTVNTLAEITRVLMAARSVETSWSGQPGVAKSVSWVTDLDLDLIKALGRRHGGTVNDVLLAVVARAVSAYLAEKGAAVAEIHWLVPVSLQPLDADLPEELGNHFSLVFLPMPLDITDPGTLIAEIRERMQRIKSSAEPVITFGVQWLIAETPKAVAVALTNLFANKGVGVLTNVPGPRGPMSLAGAPVAGTLGWAPTSGDQPLSLCLFSYHGTVNIGVAADAGLIPDPDRIAELLRDSFIAMASELG